MQLKKVRHNLFISFITLAFILAACNVPSYNDTNKKSYHDFLLRNYSDAINHLDKNKYLKAKYNEVLYLLEKGRLQMLNRQYEEAFNNLNQADLLLDSWRELKERTFNGNIELNTEKTILGATASSTLKYTPLNELFVANNKVPYRPAPFERFLIHYCKAICLLQLNRLDEAEVEAKQMNLLSQNYDDLKNMDMLVNKYVSDPLPQLMAGIIYEVEEDDNSALIEYENAYKKYAVPELKIVSGLSPPYQVQKDLVSLSNRLGFDDRIQLYEKELFTLSKYSDTSRMAIILIDNGIVPYKTRNRMKYHKENGSLKEGHGKYGTITIFRPDYVEPSKLTDEVISLNLAQYSYKPEIIYYPKHITLNNYNPKYKKQCMNHVMNQFNGDTARNTLPQNINCDTRNWQTLPGMIQFAKLQVDSGLNPVIVTFRSGRTDTVWINAVRRNNFYYIAN